LRNACSIVSYEFTTIPFTSSFFHPFCVRQWLTKDVPTVQISELIVSIFAPFI